MIKQIEVEQIKNLIKEGFDIKLISFQLEIPIELLIKYSREIEEENTPEKIERNTYLEEARNSRIKDKIKVIKQKYNKLYQRDPSTLISKLQEITEETKDAIIKSVKNIEEMMNEIRQLDISIEEQRKKIVRNSSKIIAEIKKVKEYPLTLEQSEFIFNILISGELQQETDAICSIDKKLFGVKKTIAKRIIEAVELELYKTDGIEKLKILQRKLTTKVREENSMAAQIVHSKIERRLTEMRQKVAIERIKNDIPQSMEPILYGLAKGTLDINQAQKTIEEEINKRENTKNNGKFDITIEDERKQIYMKLCSVLRERANQYRIENPEQTINLIQEICGETVENALRTVAKNLAESNRYLEAKRICERYYEQYRKAPNGSSIKMIRDEIKNQEIGYYFLRIIKHDVIESEDIEWFKILQEGLNTSNIKLKAIPLGKSCDGVRKISLADIWGEEVKQK